MMDVKFLLGLTNGVAILIAFGVVIEGECVILCNNVSIVLPLSNTSSTINSESS